MNWEVIKIGWKGVAIALIIVLLTVLVLGLVGELDKIRRLFLGVERGVEFNNYQLAGHLREEVIDIVSIYAQDNIRYPLPATINQKTGKVFPETAGKIIDITATVDKIFSVNSGETVKEVTYLITPYLVEEDLLAITEEMSSYQTIITGSTNRRINIELAVDAINNTLLIPGGGFSFNKVVGPRSKEKGFKESTQIIKGELRSGVGGGICQASSTLYNAVDVKGLEVIELHHHSQQVGYVPKGRDATVAWQYLDFKFKNNLASPIIIKAKMEENKLIISILK